MRRRVLPALGLGAVLALGTACGSGGGSPSASAPASSSTASPTTLSDDDVKAQFCDQAPALLEKVNTEVAGVQSDPQSAPRVLADAVDQLNGLKAPAGVAPQWQRFVGAVTGLRDLVGKINLSDPQANTQYADELAALKPGLVDGGAAIDDWGKANC